ncbi:maintenance of telomere capping protein 1 [Boeremia exigua]|uniref:maintenance of telomere capping protein 1 n=1 Tax=Boeremia exigua TaxID=749465 RepID=UPI001E8E642E|nr:maintenance of telomere capping protein 1 [Boeremia exigua]KAH6639287.1 maintenance of telomere capping protein 1 [Boeremia exigua]
MPPKTVEEELAELELLGAETPAAPPPKKGPKAPRQKLPQEDDALKGLEELEDLGKLQRPEGLRPTSRPNTPKLSSSTASSNRRGADVATPSSTGSARTSEDRTAPPRKSGDSARSFHQSFAPTQEEPATAAPALAAEAPASAGGSWWGGGWGGILNTATEAANAAKKQAEAAYQELQKNQEAQRWAEQVRGNVGALRGMGGELSKHAMPTFTNILHTLAPPIAQHERLQIHITHDLVGYPSLDPIVYQTFSTVMAQVEGGDLLVIQRGSELKQRGSLDGYRGGGGGWNDGPWWRHADKRDLSTVKGLVEGTKLTKVSAESYADEFFAARGGIEAAAKQATEVLSETVPVRSSDIFIAIQAISYPVPTDLFGASTSTDTTENVIKEVKDDEDVVVFAVYLYDPVHGISLKTVSQSFPAKWAEWLDAPASTEADGEAQHLPQEISEIIESGGVDPREWVSEWMEETISLSVGIVAQRYVARRMGVGEGSLGRGKAREANLEDGAGEAARAGII